MVKKNAEYQADSYKRRREAGQKPVQVWLTAEEYVALSKESKRVNRPMSYLIQRVVSLYVSQLEE